MEENTQANMPVETKRAKLLKLDNSINQKPNVQLKERGEKSF